MPKSLVVKIGSRLSPLSRIQARLVARALERTDSREIAFIGYSTTGDRRQDQSLRDLGGKEAFVEDIEWALLEKKIDLAVHSLKDMPAKRMDNTVIAAILARTESRDALVSREGYSHLRDLPRGVIIGTASPRRAAQIRSLRSDLKPILLRGNVERRLEKIRRGEIDAALLAMAGLERLGQTDMAVPLSEDIILPAAGQGAICVECRADDEEMRALCATIHDGETERLVQAERGFTMAFGASCYAPVAASAKWAEGEKEKGVAKVIFLRTQLLTPDGGQSFFDKRTGADPERLGRESARAIAEQAGEEILRLVGANIPA